MTINSPVPSSVIDESSRVVGVKSALRILAIFEFFATTGKPAILTELSQRLELPKSSCFALMETLRREGYVYSIGKRSGYFPTPRLYEIGEHILRADPVVMLADSHVQSLRDVTGETAIFGKRDGTEALYLKVREAEYAVRFTAHAGQRKMMHSGASGKALLALMPSKKRREFIAQLDRPAISPHTLVSVDDLDRAVEQGISIGWHVAVGENRIELTSIAAAFQIGGEDYFFCVAGPTQRLLEKKDEIGKVVAGLATTIGQEVSWS